MIFSIDVPVGDNTYTVTGEYDDDGDVLIEDILLGDSSVYEDIASMCAIAGGKFTDVIHHLAGIAYEQYGEQRAQYLSDRGEYLRDLRDDR